MRILVVTTKSPYPLYEGRALRTYNLLKQIAKKHEVYLLSFVQSEEEVQGIEQMRAFCARVEAIPLNLKGQKLHLLFDLLREIPSSSPLHVVKYRSRVMRCRMLKVLEAERIDLVHLDMLHLGEYANLCGERPVVLMEHNVESVLLERRMQTTEQPLEKAYLRYQTRKLRDYEAALCRCVAHVVAVSDLDAKLLRRLAGVDSVTSIPNGVDTSYFGLADCPSRPYELVYVGGMTWFPNYDAMRFFCRDILPRIAEHIPDVSLTIVGKNPDNDGVREIAKNPRVRLTGLVEDVRPLVAEAAVFIVPLRIGGGTRLKILDALSMGKPLVSTSIGCEGIEVSDGEHLVIADTPDKFAQEVEHMLLQPQFGQRLGLAGRQLVERSYEWDKIAPALDRVYETCVARSR